MERRGGREDITLYTFVVFFFFWTLEVESPNSMSMLPFCGILVAF